MGFGRLGPGVSLVLSFGGGPLVRSLMCWIRVFGPVAENFARDTGYTFIWVVTLFVFCGASRVGFLLIWFRGGGGLFDLFFVAVCVVFESYEVLVRKARRWCLRSLI